MALVAALLTHVLVALLEAEVELELLLRSRQASRAHAVAIFGRSEAGAA